MTMKTLCSFVCVSVLYIGPKWNGGGRDGAALLESAAQSVSNAQVQRSRWFFRRFSLSGSCCCPCCCREWVASAGSIRFRIGQIELTLT